SEAGALDPASLRCAAIVTDGERGCVLVQDGREIHVPAFEAREVDPTGAGDCFLAGFAVGLWRGWDPPRAALFGNVCGALAGTQPASEAMATWRSSAHGSMSRHFDPSSLRMRSSIAVRTTPSAIKCPEIAPSIPKKCSPARTNAAVARRRQKKALNM